MRARTIALTLIGGALSLGCGASSLAHLTGFRSAMREPVSSWSESTQAAAPWTAPPLATSKSAFALSSWPAAASADAAAAREGQALALPANAGLAPQGEFTLLTYNIAGLPEMFSPSNPRRNIPLVSALLNRYDVAVVQEDFSYHRELVHSSLHPFRSRPMRPRSFVGDGLNQFSRFGFRSLHRVRWERCNGLVGHATDCLADKGFSFSELTLAPGVHVHLYNLHADAGSGELDVETRGQNFAQLSRYIGEHSRAQAVIVAGDTNLRTANHRGDAETLATFVAAHGLQDACDPQVTPEEQIDRVLYRNSAELELGASRCWNDLGFVDGGGEALSDHPAIGVSLSWQRLRSEPLIAHRGEL